MERCLKLNGYPPNMKNNNTWKRNSSAHAVQRDSSSGEQAVDVNHTNELLPGPFTPQQYRRLLDLIREQKDVDSKTTNFDPGTSSTTFLPGKAC